MDDILKAGVSTKVLLLSATPVNNDLSDLRNQIYLLTEGKDNAFEGSLNIASVKTALGTAQRCFIDWAKEKAETRKTSALLESLSASFFTILDELTIARSRKHIVKYYSESLAVIGKFPEREKPHSVYTVIDTAEKFMTYDQLNDQIAQYKLSLFNPTRYVKPEFRALYADEKTANFSQENREHYLIGMMKVNFLKRLESSVTSFAISMDRTVKKIEGLQQKLHDFQGMDGAEWNPERDALDEREEAEDEDLSEALEVGAKFKFKLAHMDTEKWLHDLEQDRKKLAHLFQQATEITPERDAKLQELKHIIQAKVAEGRKDAEGHVNKKVLVFTAFADTASYLYDALWPWAKSELGLNAALVVGGTSGSKTRLGQAEFSQILTNFSPRAKNRAKYPQMPQTDEIDLLIATDCISEGQNLQDCDCVVNYDIHWNPVRLIQRFGRIDRIGSKNHTIRMVNFWPTDDLNKYINLKNRVEARMALVDLSATSQDDLLNVEEVTELSDDDFKYRVKQLLRLKDEVLDLEDLSETVSLTEFTLDDFRRDLLRYLESNRRKLEEAPLGLYALVPPDARYPQVVPGVVFCLRQKGDTQGTETVNTLQPYFLVYIRDDGEVRYSFAQPKQILDLMQALCADKETPYESLCNLFDAQTDDGRDMARYSALLGRAVADITHRFQKRSFQSLLSSRGAKLMDAGKYAQGTNDFDLITWLVIQTES